MHLAFPRPGWDLLGWVALAPVLALALTASTPRRAFVEGWVAGLLFFVPLLRWLTHTMTTFSSLTWPLAVLVLLALAGYLALFWGGVAWALAWLRGRLGARTLWLAPALWVAAELVRAYFLGGFPWGLFGYVPSRRLLLIQLAAWTGVYGVSALLVLVNTALAWASVERRWRATAVAGLLSAARWAERRWSGAPGPPRRADPARRPRAGEHPASGQVGRGIPGGDLRVYAELTQAAAPDSRLVVWPEAAVPAYLRFEPAAMRWLTDLAAAVRVPLLVGAPDAETRDAG